MRLSFNNFRGSWAGLPVAWTSGDEFDENTYREDVRSCCEVGSPGIYTGGTTGEFYAVEFDEFKRIAKATVEEAHAKGKFAMIGVSSTYTGGAAKRAKYALKIGADAIQIALPFWMEVPDTEVVNFFYDVSAASDFLPLSIYETKRSKKILTVEQHKAIKEKLSNYLMVKSNANTVGTTEEGCAAITKLGINVFGEESTLWSTLGQHGMSGCCSAFVYYAPQIVIPMYKFLEQKDWAAVSSYGTKLNRMLKFVISEFATRGYYDSALDRIGGRASGVLKTSIHCRKPYPHGTEEDVQKLRRWLEENVYPFITT
ncbi:MAG: dihydrodipicolinate synthase family protein [Chitinophagaceae bacterium]|nr:dihydrodipicolinate synthase family protein [Chitinophagaceae bacterium]